LAKSTLKIKHTYLYNGHSDVVALVNGSGMVVSSYYYDAFGHVTGDFKHASNGNRTTDKSVIRSLYGYGGYQYDDETMTYNLNSRMYDPETARYLQEDTYRGQENDPRNLN